MCNAPIPGAILEETTMRKFLMSLFVLAGVLLSGTLPASATAATGLTAKPAITSTATAGKVHFRHHGGIFFGFGGGYPYYGGYPRYRNYSYYQPRYYDNSYAYYSVRRHHRHWCDRHDRWEY
jgi:hypothetical protein